MEMAPTKEDKFYKTVYNELERIPGPVLIRHDIVRDRFIKFFTRTEDLQMGERVNKRI
jgi:hypothetical protein